MLRMITTTGVTNRTVVVQTDIALNYCEQVVVVLLLLETTL
jgi:hypothetical protein